jgi:acyl-homoserine-lactone acylase
VRGRGTLSLVLGALLLAALVLPGSALAARLGATIRRTAHGIPHVEARTYAGVGFGYGYAFAQDNICPIAEDYVTVNGERSLFFGPDGTYVLRGNGFAANNLNSDFFYKQIIDAKTIEALLAKPPPLGPVPEVRQLVRGYVAGYNRYLADAGGTNGVADQTCRGKPWVRPITVADAYRRFYQLTLLASQAVAVDGIGGAQPPGSGLPLPGGGLPLPIDAAETAQELAQRLPLDGIGSNAVAVGRAGTRDHTHGLLLGNPHFPWIGTERFYQSQLSIPGKLNVQGASLFGVPLILIGHTSTMAWSHTVSTAYRFTPYQLTLVPGSPTTYLYDGQPRQMTTREVTVQVRQADGTVQPQKRTLYWTRYGPVLNSLVGVPLPWTTTTAFAMRDANIDNFRVFNHFFATDGARSVQQELDILKRYEGIPWVNTIVADKQGNALYADIGSIPHVTNDQASQCNTAVGQATFKLLGLPVLDGSKSACEWGSDPDSVVPGLFGPSKLPHLARDDYVTNSNNSYWLSNPHQPLEGFDRIIGDERTARSLRTRIGLVMTQGRVDGSDGLGPAGFTRQNMQDMVFGDRQYAGELVRDDAVRMCQNFNNGMAPTSSGPPVAVGGACDVLAAWNRREDVGSRGAILFRRFWEHAAGASPSPWAHAFDPADPVKTPNTLDTGNPQVQAAFGDAINDLAAANIPVDAPLGQFQVATRGSLRIPIHGGPGTDGEFDAINVTWDKAKGVNEPLHGSSYVQVVTWGRGACPNARTILTYSESTNPESPFYADQTTMFSQKKWVTDLFCRAAVLRGTRSTTTVADGRATRTVRGRGKR